MAAHISALTLPIPSTGAAPDGAAATLATWLRHGDLGIGFRLRRLLRVRRGRRHRLAVGLGGLCVGVRNRRLAVGLGGLCVGVRNGRIGGVRHEVLAWADGWQSF